ncbi:MAG: hypothetical protein E6G56_03125 [Actinobacteria bacterium]|nr:MAG: hypothetical protein E6G56_03125 [Actinomycetota bacterium]
MRRPLILLAPLVSLLVGLAALGRRLIRRRSAGIRAEISDPYDSTEITDSCAVRSVQAAELTVPEETLARIWSPMHLERLARTYWRFLARCTLGAIRVVYSRRGRHVVFIARPLVLLSFRAPEYEMSPERGIVRWHIEKGVLVARNRRGEGYLQIDVRRCPPPAPGQARVHIEVEVANFYPAIASGIGRWVYRHTQSPIHVVVTHGFLRSLRRLDLAESRVGRWVPPPAPERRPPEAPRGTPPGHRPVGSS